MSFLYPSFLWALLALSIPVIIHLFNFKRYKTIYFSNNRFLQAVQKKSQSFNRLKHWVVLLSRLLALALLVLAFAQPFIPASKNSDSDSSYASIYLDNSLSMKSQGVKALLIDEAREQAVKVVKSLPKGSKIQIITNNLDSKEQRYYSPEEAIQLIDQVKPTYAFRSVEEIKSRVLNSWQNEGLNSKNRLQLFLLSDFQKSQYPNLEVLKNDNWKLHILRFEMANQGFNTAIDSVWFERPVLQPGFDQELKVIVKNYSKQKIDQLSIGLELNNEFISALEFDLKAAESKELSFSIRPGEKGDYAGKLKLEAGEPYFDNNFFFSYRVNDPLKVLVIHETKSDLFDKLYQDSLYEINYASVNNLNYGELSSYNLIILDRLKRFPSGLNSSLKEQLVNGKNLVLIPSLETTAGSNSFLQNTGLPVSYNELIENKLKVSSVAWNDAIFDKVFAERPDNPLLPTIRKYLNGIKSSFPILQLENGDQVVSRFNHNQGELVVFSTDLSKESGGLASHPIIVPIMLNSALYSTPKRVLFNSSGGVSGQQFTRTQNNGDIPLGILFKETEFIPPQKNKGNYTEIFSLPQELEPGNYPVVENSTKIGLIAVNIDARESDWDFWKATDIQEFLSLDNIQIMEGSLDNLEVKLKNLYNGYPLWHWFLTSALILLLVEITLLKLWK